MLKASFICQKCKKESLAFDPDGEVGSIVVFDFNAQVIRFDCPHCNHQNILDLGNIQKALERQTALPKIGGTRF